mgnify:CR=1 FL=1
MALSLAQSSGGVLVFAHSPLFGHAFAAARGMLTRGAQTQIKA